jgi:hypothetical protein
MSVCILELKPLYRFLQKNFINVPGLCCVVSDSALQFVFSNSLYGSTAKWEISQIFKEDRLLVNVYLEHL